MLVIRRRVWCIAALIMVTMTAGAHAATKIGYVAPQISPAAPGSTNSVAVELKNPASQSKTVHVITGVPGNGGVKCQTPVWLPAKSRLRWAVPIMIPPVRTGKFSSLPIAASIAGQSGQKRGNQFLQVLAQLTAVVEGQRSTGVTKVALAMRRQMGLSKVMTFLTTRNFPLTVSALPSIQCMYFGTFTSNLSMPQVEALRDWVLGGGRLWIDLGHATGRQMAREVLGRQYDLAYVQTIRNATYHYMVDGHLNIVRLPQSEPLRCYFSNNAKTIIKTGNWPVVMRFRIGNGQVWLCAMHWRGLINAKGSAMAELWPATREFFSLDHKSAVAKPALDMAANAIGYRVAGRQSIILIFGVMILVVAVGGWALGRKGKGGLLAGLALGTAFAASGVLFAFGQLERGPVPLSESAIQIASFSSNRCFIKGQAAIFAPRQTSESAQIYGAAITRWNKFFDAQRDCRFDYSAMQTSIKVRHLTIPSGKVVDVVYHSYQNTLAAPIAAAVVANADGFAGAIKSKYALQHFVIAGPSGILGLKITAHNYDTVAFTAGAGQILPAGQYMPGVLLTRKNQREEMLVAAQLQTHPVHSLELLSWSRNFPPAWSITKAKLRLCSTLVVLPIQPRLPAAGHAVLIPWSMVRMQIVRGPHGQMSAPVYNFERHRWISHLTISGHVFMKFSVPRSLRSINVAMVHLAFAVAAPGRTVSLAIRNGKSWVPVAVEAGGTGTINKSLPVIPGEYHHGHILLRLTVGFPTQAGVGWHFVYGRVLIRGKAE